MIARGLVAQLKVNSDMVQGVTLLRLLECAPRCSTCLVLFGQNKDAFPVVCWLWAKHWPPCPSCLPNSSPGLGLLAVGDEILLGVG